MSFYYMYKCLLPPPQSKHGIIPSLPILYINVQITIYYFTHLWDRKLNAINASLL